jgi:hypothetical protein
LDESADADEHAHTDGIRKPIPVYHALEDEDVIGLARTQRCEERADADHGCRSAEPKESRPEGVPQAVLDLRDLRLERVQESTTNS